MLQNELLHLLALLRVDGVGDIVAKKLLSHFGSAEAIFKAKKKSFFTIFLLLLYISNFFRKIIRSKIRSNFTNF